jgi:hypothetical protein
MSLLCVTVKRARLQGSIDDFHSYVTLKLQNVKSTTVAVRGVQPQWEQEFIFETNRLDQALILELWNKGVLWDKLLGVCFMPLRNIGYSNFAGAGTWFEVDHEFRILNGETIGTINSTGHSVLVDCRFELPYGVESVSDIHQQLLNFDSNDEQQTPTITHLPINQQQGFQQNFYPYDQAGFDRMA